VSVVNRQYCVSVCLDDELRQVSPPHPVILRHCQQLAGSNHYQLRLADNLADDSTLCQQLVTSNQQPQQLADNVADNVTLCQCHCPGHELVDTSTRVVGLADSHCYHVDEDDEDDALPTWRRRSDIDTSDVGRTCDSVNICQRTARSLSS